MKTRKWPSYCMAILTVLCMGACQEWGEVDPPAGNQKLPEAPDTSAKLIAEFTFNENFNSTVEEGETPISGEAFTYAVGNSQPEIIQDDSKGSGVLHLKGGYLRIPNPLKDLELQTGASLSFWMRMPQIDTEGALFSFSDGGSNLLYFTANAFISYTGTGGYLDVNDPKISETNAIAANEWCYIAMTFTNKGYALYVDGEKKYDTNNHENSSSGKSRAIEVNDFDYSNITKLLTSATYLYIGYGAESETKEGYYANLKIWKNTFSDSDTQGGGKQSSNKIAGAYSFDNNFMNVLDETQIGSLITVGEQTDPSRFVEDPIRGWVWQQQEGWWNTGSTHHTNGHAYVQLPNPLKGINLNGVTVSLWINPTKSNLWDQIFVLNNGTGKFWFNAGCYMGFNDGSGDYFDCNRDCSSEQLPVGEWTYATITLTSSSFQIYLNGKLKYDVNTQAKWHAHGSVPASDFDFKKVLDLFTNSDYLFLGQDTYWGAAPCLVDELKIFNYAVSAETVQILNLDAQQYCNLDADFINSIGAGIGEMVTMVEQATPSSFVLDEVRGRVWNQQEGHNTHKNGFACTKFPNPLKGLSLKGATISVWANATTTNKYEALWGFSNNDSKGNIWYSGARLGFNDQTGNWFDCYSTVIPEATWFLLTTVFTDSGFEVYFNKNLAYSSATHNFRDEEAGKDRASEIPFTKYQKVLDCLTSREYFFLGYGGYWGCAGAKLDDLIICNRALSADEIGSYYEQTKK